MAPIIAALKFNHMHFEVCVTGQHREMLDQVLEFFEIKPEYDLKLMRKEQSLNSLSALILEKIDIILQKTKPDIILVQGDTTTAFIAALAAFNRGIKIGHVEAGLRSQKLNSPFPEEANRQLISRIADFNFVPTELNRENLLREGISSKKIFTTGNTVIDALLIATKKLDSGYENDELKQIKKLLQENKKLILVTGHRRENLGKRFINICEALLEISERNDVQLIFPVHLNPNVREPVNGLLKDRENILLLPPLCYPTMIWLTKHADVIISDSGGIQEEAPAFKTPVIVTRDVTERVEGVEAGFSFLVGAEKKKIVLITNFILENCPDYKDKVNPYGDGTASIQIINFLKEFKIEREYF